ncbi:hypothetical protein M5X00_03805 [Paenibacillus alvei]|uniref:Uncharacterized protein n=1 Tax=Paenibacillus alvei TaxID=44250 RepID=A0ABT4GU65_PAEAL|nr:hypothetical protein [Paenibacillus alvei]EJW17326.1 hypothetical protein PAV_4c04300 [Paenibacillus alvei DSM 29]MCY9542928.1 hypothetical protein [Paenibacillus alvei]MCY9705699.1 hypothetical protein [Paenibacillus alvei]MCY9732897.1 hypothetical protein [Paenibacillus alvei]MCY9753385.1 hypothetical protein [Paenibacillus alvei]
MNNQTKYTNTENSEQISSFAGSPCQEPGASVCRGDIRYVCRGGHWQSTGRFCQEDNLSQSLEQNFPDDMGSCEQEGSTTCIGDIRFTCKNGRWKPTYDYCQSDNTPT